MSRYLLSQGPSPVTNDQRRGTCRLVWSLVIGSLVISGVARADTYFSLARDEKFDRTDEDRYKERLRDREGIVTDDDRKTSWLAARYIIYPLTDFKRHDVPGKMALLIRQCEHLLTLVYGPETRNVPLKQEFGRSVLKALDQVLTPPEQRAIARVNATRVLARLAGLSGQEETIDLLLKVITDPTEVDGARYWAFRGLRELYGRSKTTQTVNDAARTTKVVEVLSKFIEKKWNLPPNPPLEIIDGARVVRREAVRALSEVRDPRGARALLKVLGNDQSLVPETRLDERIEGAVGIGWLRPDPKGDYQVGYATHHLGRLLVEFATAYGRRQGNREPWKVHGARLEESLRALVAAHPTDPTVKAVAPPGLVIVTAIQGGSDPVTARSTLETWLNGNPPAQNSVFKSDPEAKVTPRAGG
jgi:PBS lyase HEAT-like repeat